MGKVSFQNNDFDSLHEATCAALFTKYGWKWEQPQRALNGWFPDFTLRGNVTVHVECKGRLELEWEDVPVFAEPTKYEDAVRGTPHEVLLIPKAPRRVKNTRSYETNVLGFLFDGNIWSYAELGRWSGNVGFCHSANSWKDRITGKAGKKSSGDGQPPDIETDWLVAESMVNGKRISLFKGFSGADVKTWEPSSDK